MGQRSRFEGVERRTGTLLSGTKYCKEKDSDRECTEMLEPLKMAQLVETSFFKT